jgi:hypothetical protein
VVGSASVSHAYLLSRNVCQGRAKTGLARFRRGFPRKSQRIPLPFWLDEPDPNEEPRDDRPARETEQAGKDQADHVAPCPFGQTHRPIIAAQTPLCTYGKDHARPW